VHRAVSRAAAQVGYDQSFPGAGQESQALPQADLLLIGHGLAVVRGRQDQVVPVVPDRFDGIISCARGR